MSKIDLSNLLRDMLNAAKGELGEKWPIAKDYAETEFKKIGEQILFIEKRQLTGEISEEEAKLLLSMQANASKAVLFAIEGIGLMAAEKVIAAAMRAIEPKVRQALSFSFSEGGTRDH